MIKPLYSFLALGLLSFNVSATTYACEGDVFAEQGNMPDSKIDWVVDSDGEIAKGSVSFMVMAPAKLDGRSFVSLNAFILQGNSIDLHFPLYAGEDGSVVYANFTLPKNMLENFELRYGYVENKHACEKLYFYRATPTHNK